MGGSTKKNWKNKMIDVKINDEETITMSIREAKAEIIAHFFGKPYSLYDAYKIEKNKVGSPCVSCGWKFCKDDLDSFGKCNDCCDPADYNLIIKNGLISLKKQV